MSALPAIAGIAAHGLNVRSVANSRRAGRLFVLEAPRAVPIGARRMLLQLLDAAQQRGRRSVGRDGFQYGMERGARLVPAPGPIGLEPVRIPRSQQTLFWRQFVLSTQQLENRLRLRLARHHQPIDFAKLNCVIGLRHRRFRNQRAAAVQFVRGLEPRCEINRVAHDRVVHQDL
jgi:hypothetical protein